jgi:prolipoprotein diacylglyceryl transferase
MYPTISDLLNDLLGIYIPLPIQTFGFFMGLSFLGAYWATSSELQRKEKNGLLKPVPKTILLYKRATLQDYVTQIVLGMLIGYKLLDIVFHYGELLSDTQGFILSTRGNIVGALLGGGISYYLLKQEDEKARKHEPEQKLIWVQPHQLMGNILLIAAISGLLGAKIFHNLENLDDFTHDPIGALLSFSGLTFYGGLIVAAIAVLRYTGKNGINWKHMIDAAAPALMLAYGIGRIGCQMSGDGDWGIVNLAPKPDWMSALPEWIWSYTYPHNVVGEGIPIPGCEGNHCAQLPQPVYPTPLYEVMMSLVIFGILWAIRKAVQVPAMIFCIYLMFNGVERFLIEQIRVNTTYHIGNKFITQAEIISVLLFCIGLVGALYLFMANRKNTSRV